MIFVFEVHIKPGYTAEAYASAWVEASEIIQRAAGARGTRLHRSSTRPDVLLAIASWDTKELRDAAESARDPRVRQIIDAQAEHVEIRVVGEFDDPEWVVLPPAPSQ
jgi:heme-degrading monooxygenase HmoA